MSTILTNLQISNLISAAKGTIPVCVIDPRTLLTSSSIHEWKTNNDKTVLKKCKSLLVNELVKIQQCKFTRSGLWGILTSQRIFEAFMRVPAGTLIDSKFIIDIRTGRTSKTKVKLSKRSFGGEKREGKKSQEAEKELIEAAASLHKFYLMNLIKQF